MNGHAILLRYGELLDRIVLWAVGACCYRVCDDIALSDVAAFRILESRDAEAARKYLPDLLSEAVVASDDAKRSLQLDNHGLAWWIEHLRWLQGYRNVLQHHIDIAQEAARASSLIDQLLDAFQPLGPCLPALPSFDQVEALPAGPRLSRLVRALKGIIEDKPSNRPTVPVQFNAPDRTCVVVGPPFSDKERLAMAIAHEWSPRISPIVVSLRDHPLACSGRAILALLERHLNLDVWDDGDTPKRSKRVIDTLRQRQTVLIVEGAEYLDGRPLLADRHTWMLLKQMGTSLSIVLTAERRVTWMPNQWSFLQTENALEPAPTELEQKLFWRQRLRETVMPPTTRGLLRRVAIEQRDGRSADLHSLAHKSGLFSADVVGILDAASPLVRCDLESVPPSYAVSVPGLIEALLVDAE
ncbi:MAG: hypothetical protein ABI779_18135 [Acidobacteriota bacterium]